MNNLAITGCQGRMGKRIVALAIMDGFFEISALLEKAGTIDGSGSMNGIPISSSLTAMEGCDVLIDFTVPENTMQNLKYCRQHGINMVIGTTGFTDDQEQLIAQAAADIAIVYSSNMSIGVNILFKLTELLAQATPQSYAVFIREAHHVHKQDAPSGTAKTLARGIQAVSPKKVDNIDSIRKDEIVGDHEVIFESPEDIITIKHHAKNRDIFAKGALAAAKFLMNEKSGLFNMRQVLKLDY